MAPRVGRKPPEERKPIPDALKQTTTSEGVMQGVQPRVGTDSGGGTVTVACNLPNGLILRLFDWIDDRSNPPDKDGKRQKIAIQSRDKRKQPVRLHGWAVPWQARPKFMIIAGKQGSMYALTTGVDREFWKQWLEQNHESPVVTERMVYAMDNEREATQEALGNGVKSGLEPIDPTAIRVPDASLNKHIKLETATDD